MRKHPRAPALNPLCASVTLCETTPPAFVNFAFFVAKQESIRRSVREVVGIAASQPVKAKQESSQMKGQ